MAKRNLTNSIGEKCKAAKYTMRSTLKQIAIKCYEEQLPNGGFKALEERIKGILPMHMWVMAILHNKCPKVTDDIWASELEKPHVHIICVLQDAKQYKIEQFLKELGIVFRKDQDEILFTNHGVESVRNLASYTMYLTHETEQAISDGKYQYEISDIVSNLTTDEIEGIRNGYTRLTRQKLTVDTEELVMLDDAAFKIGYELKDFNKWYDSLTFAERSHCKMKTIKESYKRGIHARVHSDDNEVIRLCIFIKGEPGTGKTYATNEALKDKPRLNVSGGGTGKFDELQPYHRAIIIDDDVCPNLLNIADNYFCQAYRRNNNNPYWCGDYLVVTCNDTFDEWLDKCGRFSNEQKKALKSRFYVCHVEEIDNINTLIVDSVSKRGSYSEQEDRYNRFIEFKERFNNSIANYKVTYRKFDYSQLFTNVKKEKVDVHPLDKAIKRYDNFRKTAKANGNTMGDKELVDLFLKVFPQHEGFRDILIEVFETIASNTNEHK